MNPSSFTICTLTATAPNKQQLDKEQLLDLHISSQYSKRKCAGLDFAASGSQIAHDDSDSSHVSPKEMGKDYTTCYIL
jgi:hypothetical protein